VHSIGKNLLSDITETTLPLLETQPLVEDGLDAPSNCVTACNKCNGRKSAKAKEAFAQQLMAWRVKRKYGEPQQWDGLSSLFLVFAGRNVSTLAGAERSWYDALGKVLAETPSSKDPAASSQNS
jgi:hypothetical protein